MSESEFDAVDAPKDDNGLYTCEGCALIGDYACINAKCHASEREDGRAVIFIEKQGE